jgi:hypothetical protein
MSDELASIAGLASAVLMDVGEEKEVGSATSKSVYKVKRHPDHYFWCVLVLPSLYATYLFSSLLAFHPFPSSRWDPS